MHLHWNKKHEYYRYRSNSNEHLRKVQCNTIWGCGTIRIISRNKNKTLQIVPQWGAIRGCITNRVNTLSCKISKNPPNICESCRCGCSSHFYNETTLFIAATRPESNMLKNLPLPQISPKFHLLCFSVLLLCTYYAPSCQPFLALSWKI